MYLGSIFIPEKYVNRVLFVSPWPGSMDEPDTPSYHSSGPPRNEAKTVKIKTSVRERLK